MKVTNGLVTYTDLSTMGLAPNGTPATGNRIATKLFITTNYYVDETASPFASYSNDRCPPYQTIKALYFYSTNYCDASPGPFCVSKTSYSVGSAFNIGPFTCLYITGTVAGGPDYFDLDTLATYVGSCSDPSCNLPTFYTWYISYGLGDPSIYGCDSSGPFPTTVYSDNSSFISSTNFYNDTTLTSQFNGGSYWYADSTFESGTMIQIDSNGHNINSYGC
jgi:hypothetical protein